VDYQDTGAESGKVSLAGTGEPGAHILLFFDEAPLGEVVVEDDGTWVFAAEKKLETGEHKFRADRDEGGVVVGSASIGLVRMEQPKAPPKEEVAAETPPPAPATGPESTPKAAVTPPESQVAAAEEAKPAATGEKQAHYKRHSPKVYTVRRGDTLWEIAESYYGGGWHYRAIVRDNKRNIKNPHWIYPKQKFHIRTGRAPSRRSRCARLALLGIPASSEGLLGQDNFLRFKERFEIGEDARPAAGNGFDEF
jgi:LysM repeat protein